MRIERYLDEAAAEAIREAFGVEQPALLRATQDPKLGDYQVNAAMPLAKQLKKPPREIAGPIAERMRAHPAIAEAEVAGPGFVNLRLDDGWVADRLAEALADTERDGVPRIEHPKKIVVDFSSPNIAKQMHVGHLRSTIIGDAIARLLDLVGHEVIRDNHLGDWGTQFGLLIVGMREWGSDEALGKTPILELERVYKLASERAKTDEAFADRARAELAKLQAGDPSNRALWERFVAATRVTLDAIYDRLDVRFDEWLGESAYDAMLPGVVEKLLAAGIAREDQGAICVFFDDWDEAPAELKNGVPFIVRKKDGAYNYATSDIATVIYRKDHFAADASIYVVDSRQSRHFKQLFAVMKRLGVDMELEHVGFGTVLGPDNKPLRTRDAAGNVITLASLLDEAEQRAQARMIEEGIDLPADRIPEVARAVGIGAVKYADLRQNRASDYQFDWDKMISFKGNAGPYMQYAYARIESIFRKGEVDGAALRGPVRLDAPTEAALGRQLLRFGELVHQAAESSLPHIVTDHLFALARAYSAFYEACPVLRAEGSTRESRLALAALTGRQLRRGLSLLGIQVVDRM